MNQTIPYPFLPDPQLAKHVCERCGHAEPMWTPEGRATWWEFVLRHIRKCDPQLFDTLDSLNKNGRTR